MWWFDHQPRKPMLRPMGARMPAAAYTAAAISHAQWWAPAVLPAALSLLLEADDIPVAKEIIQNPHSDTSQWLCVPESRTSSSFLRLFRSDLRTMDPSICASPSLASV